MNIKNFYPTPIHLISRMLGGIDLSSLKILEPSAGKGDIVDYIKNDKYSYNNRDCDVECIEIEPELQSILKGKGYRLVYDDFLTYQTYKHYDYIIMNPPFDNGEKHLLKALEMQKNGGKIICLLNAETLSNLCSNTRKELDRKLLELDAKIEYLSDQFTTEDTFRKTSVKIALIRIDIPNKQEESDILKNLKQATYNTINDEEIQNYLISSDHIEGLIQQYNFEIQAGFKLISEYYAMSKLFLKSFDRDKYDFSSSILCLTINNSSDKYSEDKNLYNRFADMVRNKYWRALFQSKQIIEISTSQLRDEYYKKLDTLANYEFNLFNINQIRLEMMSHLYKSVEDTIMSLFDELSYQSSWDNEFSKNIHYYNGWKTNKSWFINKKVILRLNGYSTWQNNRIDFDYKFRDKLSDIEKVFNYLDNGLTKELDLSQALAEAEKYGISKDIDTKYMKITVYKKGTTHLEFKDLELLKKFNIFGSQKKGWLPPSFAKKTYNEMPKEEKEVINEFCGEQDYQNIYDNQDYYIYKVENVKLLA